MSRTLAVLAVLLVGLPLGSQAATIVVGTRYLAPDTPGQSLALYVTGTDQVAGANLYAQIGDGGPELADYGLPAGTDGPSITAVDLKTGTIFQSLPGEPFDLGSIPQVALWGIALEEPGTYILADGLLATLTVDTTGFTSGTWPLLLSGVLPGLGGYDTDFAGVDAQITNGSIQLAVPGDADGDGFVNAADAAILAAHWLQQSGASWGDGDFNGDTKVDDLDLAVLAANWSPGQPAGAAVPEPTAAVLVVGLLAAWLVRWIRGRVRP
ncbi:MAG: hypothetical protein JW809_05205 [Pirellulales bacterium]|nr:hypothetical protein [Pirellulales bacterium]